MPDIDNQERDELKPTISFLYLKAYRYIRHTRLGHVYIVPHPYQDSFYVINFDAYGVSIYKDEIWIWREIGNGDFEAIIIKKNADINQILSDLSKMDYSDLEKIIEVLNEVDISSLDISKDYLDYLKELKSKIDKLDKLFV